MSPVWRGTEDEAAWLQVVLGRNCTCERSGDGGVGSVVLSKCVPHRMLDEQRVMDGLVWMRRAAGALLEEEGVERP